MKPTRHKVLLIGEAPNGGGMRSHLLESILLRTANRPAARSCHDSVRAWLEYTDEPRMMALAAEVHHVNLLDEYPGRKQRGSAFDMEEARRQAEFLHLWLQRRPTKYPYLLLAGQRVAQAMGGDAPGNPPFTSFQWARRCACLVPHPSGVNRWWNDEANRQTAQQHLLNLGEIMEALR